jgi:hypothetical protein
MGRVNGKSLTIPSKELAYFERNCWFFTERGEAFLPAGKAGFCLDLFGTFWIKPKSVKIINIGYKTSE